MSEPMQLDVPAASVSAHTGQAAERATPGPAAPDASPGAAPTTQAAPASVPPEPPSATEETDASHCTQHVTPSTRPSARASPTTAVRAPPQASTSMVAAEGVEPPPVPDSVATPTSRAPSVSGVVSVGSAPPNLIPGSAAVPEYDSGIVIGSEADRPMELTVAQVKYLQNVLKALKGRTEARAFLAPVDPVALGIPHYRTIITRPMDLGTIDVKLALTAAAIKGGNKPTEKVKMAPRWGLDLRRDVYSSAAEVEKDVRLTFNNTRVFNGPTHLISLSADALESAFDKQIKGLPSGEAQELQPRKSIDLSSDSARPKREVQPPAPPAPFVEQDEPTKPSTKYRRDSMSLAEEAHWDKVAREEVKFCGRVINELLKPANSAVAWVFYDLPDPSLDYAPAYYAMISRPIALNDIMSKMRKGDYSDADEFDTDMQQLFRNCFTFNPPGSDVYVMGERLKAVYERTFSKLPTPRPYLPDPSPEQAEALQVARMLRDQAQTLLDQAAELESKPSPKGVQTGRQTLSALGVLPPLTPSSPQSTAAKRRKSVNGDAPKKPPAKKAKKVAPEAAPAEPVEKKPQAKRPRKPKAGDLSDDEDVRVVTYEQKEELANKIQTLSEERMDGALKIIAEDRPESTMGDEEIELDIDDLSPRTLYRLYRFVVRPKDKKTTHSKPVKNANDGRKRGTGGLKGKTLNESEETERIRRLQAQLQQFEGTAAPLAPTTHDDLVNSESSGDEDSDSGEDY